MAITEWPGEGPAYTRGALQSREDRRMSRLSRANSISFGSLHIQLIKGGSCVPTLCKLLSFLRTLVLPANMRPSCKHVSLLSTCVLHANMRPSYKHVSLLSICALHANMCPYYQDLRYQHQFFLPTPALPTNTSPSYQDHLSFLPTPALPTNISPSYQHLSWDLCHKYQPLLPTSVSPINICRTVHPSKIHCANICPYICPIHADTHPFDHTMISLQLTSHAPQKTPYSTPSTVVPQAGLRVSFPTGGEMKGHCASNGLYSVLQAGLLTRVHSCGGPVSRAHPGVRSF